MDKDLASQVADIAQRVVASGAISANGHGNVSIRAPGSADMYFTAGPSLRDHAASAVVRLALDGSLLEGELPTIQGAVVAMHAAINAAALGGPVEIPAELRAAALQRAMVFDSQGTVRA
jgi:L-fuculose-phosphate aldolase